MTDPFDITTTRQRAYVMVALVLYFVLFAIDVTTNIEWATAASDLVIAALAIPASILIIRRATAGETVDWIAAVAAGAFLLAGIGIGYGGLAVLTDLPESEVVAIAGSAALIVAVILYLYRSWT